MSVCFTLPEGAGTEHNSEKKNISSSKWAITKGPDVVCSYVLCCWSKWDCGKKAVATFTQLAVFVLTEKWVTGGSSNTLTASFVQTLHTSATKTLQMLTEAYCPDTMRKFAVYEWHERFKDEDDKDTKHYERTEWPTASDPLLTEN